MAFHPFLIITLVPIVVLLGFALGSAWNFLLAGVIFVLIPLLDFIIGRNRKNPAEELEKDLDADRTFRIITWVLVPIQISLVIWGTIAFSTAGLTLIEKIGLISSVGISSGVIGINISHELVHRFNKFERFLGFSMLWSTLYMHWGIEHVSGHHRFVATPEDPATARLGESLYRFLPRTILGGLKSSWDIESLRLERMKISPWNIRNRILQYGVLQIAFILAVAWFLPFGSVLFVVLQALVGISLLEIVNYVEHYGLLRKQLPDGRYEPVDTIHSWNSSERLTNYFLFNLQRHSDHHANPQRRYQLLRHMEESPQLPTGYSGMLLLALVPPLWFAVMNPRVPKSMVEMGNQADATIQTPA